MILNLVRINEIQHNFNVACGGGSAATPFAD